MHRGVHGFDAGEVVVGEFPGRHVAALELTTPFGDPHPPDCQLNWTLSAGLGEGFTAAGAQQLVIE
jgi:hypothetical protein